MLSNNFIYCFNLSSRLSNFSLAFSSLVIENHLIFVVFLSLVMHFPPLFMHFRLHLHLRPLRFFSLMRRKNSITSSFLPLSLPRALLLHLLLSSVTLIPSSFFAATSRARRKFYRAAEFSRVRNSFCWRVNSFIFPFLFFFLRFFFFLLGE